MSKITVSGPKGAFEIDEADRAKWAANNYREVPFDTLGTPRAMSPAGVQAQRQDFLASQPEAPSVGEVTRAVAPTGAAIITGMLAPEVPAAAGIGRLLTLLATRVAIPGIASAATDAGVQTLRGEKPDFSSAQRGAWDALGEGIGLPFDWLRARLGYGAMSSAMRVSKPDAKYAQEMASQLAGRQVPAHEADLVDQAIRERIAPGPPIFPSLSPREGTGSLKLESRMSAPMERRAEIIQQAAKAGNTATRQDFTQFVPDLRAELARGPNGTKNVAQMERLLQDFISQGTKKGTRLGPGNPMKKLSPTEWEQLKEEWQTFAQNAYGKQTGEKGAVADKFAKAIAAGIQDRLERLTPPSVPGGIGEIARLNREYRSFLPLEQAVGNAELPRTDIGGGLEKFNPLRYIPSNVKGRAALALTGGPAKFSAQQGPEVLSAIARILALPPAGQ